MAFCSNPPLCFLSSTITTGTNLPKRSATALISGKVSPSKSQFFCNRQEKPIINLSKILVLSRSWFMNCFNVFTSGIMTCSIIMSFNPTPHALANADLGFRYPCEDVSGYYSGVDTVDGIALMKVLNSKVSNHRSLSYKEVWDALKVLDAANVDHPETSLEVVEIYSLRAVAKSLAGKPEGWNREHLWPCSYGLKSGPSLTDLHNIRPADVNVNSSRGNKYYGECAAESIICLKPANPEAAPDTETDRRRWAPPLQVRGDVARSIMYMAVRYAFHSPDGKQYLRLSNSPSTRNREMGLLSALLQWNKLDPPSRAEQLRNERICKIYQHNRNPFVDHPEFADLIWKNSLVSSRFLHASPPKAG